jgi:integrase
MPRSRRTDVQSVGEPIKQTAKASDRGEITARLTDAFVSKLQYRPNGPNTYNHANKPGLSCHVSKRGVVTFKLRLSNEGRRSAPLGTYNRATYNMDMIEAAAANKKLAWKNGEETVADVPTLAELIKRYTMAREKGERDAGRRADGPPANWGKLINYFETIYKPLLPRSTDKLRVQHFHECEDDYLNQREKETGNRPNAMLRSIIASVTKPMMHYAVVKHWFPREDWMGIRAGKTDEGIRFLLPGELQRTFKAADELPAHAGLFYRFLLAMGCRMGTALQMLWIDLHIERVYLDGKYQEMMVWRVPRERMVKGDRAIFPVVGEAREIIETLRALRLAEQGDWPTVFPPLVISKWDGNRDKITKLMFAKSDTFGWHRHDLRRTHATYLGYAGARKGLVALSLNHASGKEVRDVTDVYLKSTNYLELSQAHLLMHQLMKDIEEGRESESVLHLQSELVFNTDAQEFCDELHIDWAMARIKPSMPLMAA